MVILKGMSARSRGSVPVAEVAGCGWRVGRRVGRRGEGKMVGRREGRDENVLEVKIRLIDFGDGNGRAVCTVWMR